jgi:hypothetical protein
MVAALYDESLDAFAGHNWLKRLDIFRRDYSSAQPSFENTAAQLAQFLGKGWQVRYQPAPVTYRAFPQDLVSRGMRLMRNSGRAYFGLGGGDAIRTRMSLGDAQPMSAAPGALARTESLAAASSNMDAFGAAEPAKLALADRTVPAPAPAQIPLGSVSARKNLQETAFFYPQLLSDSNGVVRLSFVMPEALTRWHFLGFAHDKKMRSGSLEDHAGHRQGFDGSDRIRRVSCAKAMPWNSRSR